MLARTSALKGAAKPGLVCLLCVMVIYPACALAGWIDDWNLTDNSNTSYVPANNSRAIAYDDSGNLHVVWFQYMSGRWDVFYRRLSKAGWDDPEQLTNTAAASYDPTIVAEGDGTLHVVYSEGNAIEYRRFYGSAWTPAVSITDSGSVAGYPAMAMGPGGSLHLVWEDLRHSDDEIYYKYYDGVTWGSDERLTVGSGSINSPAVAVDQSGKVHVVWDDDRTGTREIFYKKFDGVWGADQQLTTDSSLSFLPAVEVTGDGAVHVVWVDLRTGDYEIYYKRYKGAGWSPDVRLTYYPGLAWNTSIAVNSSGHLHLVWHDNRDGNTEIYHKVFDGSSWQLEERLTYSAATSKNPSVAVNDDGDVYVVWHDFRDGSYEVYWKWFIAGTPPPPEVVSVAPVIWPADEGIPISDLVGSGFMWLAEVRLQKAGEADLPATEVVVEAPARITCTIGLGGAAEGYWDVVVENIDGRMDTLPSGIRVVPGPWTGDNPLTNDVNVSLVSKPNARSVACDGTGNVHVVWYDDRDDNQEIYYKKYDGQAWSADERLTTTLLDSQQPSIAVDQSQNLHVVWSEYVDATNSEIYYKRFDGSVWDPDERLTDSPGASETPSIAAGADSNLYVVWADQRDTMADIYFRQFDGTAWLPEDSISRHTCHDAYPAVVVDASEHVHVVWAESDGSAPPANVNYRAHDGLSWGSIQVLSVGTAVSAPSMAVDENDGLHVCWNDTILGAPGSHEVFYRYFDGMGWDAPRRLSRAVGRSRDASVAAAAGSIVFVVWADDRNGTSELYFRRFNGAAWEAETRLTFDTAESLLPSTATWGDLLHVVWCDERDANPEIYYKLRDPAVVSGIPTAEARAVFSGRAAIVPNPVCRDASIRFGLGREASVQMSIYDVTGRMVWQSNAGIMGPGRQEITWGTRDRFGDPVAPGIYFMTIRAGTESATAKLVILR